MGARSRSETAGQVARIAPILILILAGAAGLVVTAKATDRRADAAERRARTDEISAAAASVRALLLEASSQAAAVAAAVPDKGDVNERGQALASALAGATLLDDAGYLIDDRGVVVVTPPSLTDLRSLPRPLSAAARPSSGPAPRVTVLAEDPLEHRLDVLVVAPAPGGATFVGRARVGGRLTSALGDVPAPARTQLLVVDSADPPEQLNGTLPAQAGVGMASGLIGPAMAARRGLAGLGTARAEGGGRVEEAHAPASAGWAVLIVEPLGQWRSRQGRTAALLAGPLAAAVGIALLLLVLTELQRGRERRRLDHATSAILSVAGHELRTPLTAIRGFSDTLARRGDALPPARRQEVAGAIARQARMLEHLIERMLTAARLESGATSTVLSKPVRLEPVLAGVLEVHEALAPVHDFELDAAPDVWVLGDPGAITQVVGHLVENAVKYSPAGGSVAIRAVSRRGRVEISVEDEGIGLPSDHARLFDRFAQNEAVDTRTYDEGGLGLGLSIVRALVQQMHGTVHAEPRLPRGARFVVVLPHADGPA